MTLASTHAPERLAHIGAPGTALPARGHAAADTHAVQAGRFAPLLAVTVASIFLGLELEAGPLKLRPFDLLALLTVVAVVVRTGIVAVRGAPFIVVGTVFAAVILVNGLGLSTARLAVQESVQMLYLVGVFAVGAFVVQTPQAFEKFLRVFLVALVAIALFNAGYHVSQGFLMSWKTLDEPKLAHAYSVFFLGVALLSSAAYRRPKYVVVFAAMLALMLLSADRKGWGAAAAGLVAAAMISEAGGLRVRAAVRLAVPAVLVALVLALVWQIESVRVFLSGRFASIADFVRYSVSSMDTVQYSRLETTISNRARLVGMRVATDLFQAAPVFGSGVNSYSGLIDAMPIPERMKHGAHNEYLRIAAELGLVGLVAYLALYLTILWRSLRYVLRMPWLSETDRLRVRLAFGALAYAAAVNFLLGGGAVSMVFLFLSAMLVFSLRPDPAPSAPSAPSSASNAPAS